MVAISLGMVLMSGVVEVYLSIKTTFSAQERLARVQENGRLATIVLSRNISKAGYAGCNSRNLQNSIQGYVGSKLPKFLQNRAIPNSDAIVIKRADENITTLTKDIIEPATTVYVVKNPATQSRPYVLVSNCEYADLVTAKNYSGRTIKLTKAIKHSYLKGETEVAGVISIAFFIGKTSRNNKTGQPIHALYYTINEKRKVELIEDVENMQIEYGVDDNGNGKVDKYYRASQIADWSKVLSVVMTLYLVADGSRTVKWPIYVTLEQKIN